MSGPDNAAESSRDAEDLAAPASAEPGTELSPDTASSIEVPTQLDMAAARADVQIDAPPPRKSTDVLQAYSSDVPHVGWRLKLAIALTLPLVALEIVNLYVDGAPISRAIGRGGFLAVQAVLGLAVVLVCGWPILARMANNPSRAAQLLFAGRPRHWRGADVQPHCRGL